MSRVVSSPPEEGAPWESPLKVRGSKVPRVSAEPTLNPMTTTPAHADPL